MSTFTSIQWSVEHVKRPVIPPKPKRTGYGSSWMVPVLYGSYKRIPPEMFTGNTFVFREESSAKYSDNSTQHAQMKFWFVDYTEGIASLVSEFETYKNMSVSKHEITYKKRVKLFLDLEISFEDSIIETEEEFLDVVVYGFIVRNMVSVYNQLMKYKISTDDICVFSNCSEKWSAHLICDAIGFDDLAFLEQWCLSTRAYLEDLDPEFYLKYRIDLIMRDIKEKFLSLRMPYSPKLGKTNPLGYYDPKTKKINYEFNRALFLRGLITYFVPTNPINLISAKHCDFFDRSSSSSSIETIYQSIGQSESDQEDSNFHSKSKTQVSFPPPKRVAKDRTPDPVRADLEQSPLFTNELKNTFKDAIQKYYKKFYKPDFNFDWGKLRISYGYSHNGNGDAVYVVNIFNQLPCCYVWHLRDERRKYEISKGISPPISARDHRTLIRAEISFSFNLGTKKMHQCGCWNDVCTGALKKIIYEMEF